MLGWASVTEEVGKIKVVSGRSKRWVRRDARLGEASLQQDLFWCFHRRRRVD